jgi:predicted anti-sigma-YlaC factor YlaD
VKRLKECWHLLNLPCDGVTRLASDSLDRDLTRLERLALRSHILYCKACRLYLRQLKLISHALRHMAAHPETCEPLSGARLPDHVREEIKRSLRGN